MRAVKAILFPALALGVLCGATAAKADGVVPFYGYVDYYGGPAIYYSHDNDVQQTTRPVHGAMAIGVRTYSAGGPFWAYKPVGSSVQRVTRTHRAVRHARVLRRKG